VIQKSIIALLPLMIILSLLFKAILFWNHKSETIDFGKTTSLFNHDKT
jgi:hypothetical protein